MLRHNDNGFTMVELLVSISLIGILTTIMFTFSNVSINQYLNLHKEGLEFSELAIQSHRVGNVLRGITDITAVSANEITCYSYFSPNDTYVSLIRYYKSADGKKLLADVTRMSSNPPIGTPITESLETFTIISNYYTSTGVDLFNYLDAAGNALTLPVSELHTIKGVRANLAVQNNAPVANGSEAISLTVSLRNRKTNL